MSSTETLQLAARAFALKSAGMSPSAVAAELNVALSYVYKLVKMHTSSLNPASTAQTSRAGSNARTIDTSKPSTLAAQIVQMFLARTTPIDISLEVGVGLNEINAVLTAAGYNVPREMAKWRAEDEKAQQEAKLKAEKEAEEQLSREMRDFFLEKPYDSRIDKLIEMHKLPRRKIIDMIESTGTSVKGAIKAREQAQSRLTARVEEAMGRGDEDEVAKLVPDQYASWKKLHDEGRDKFMEQQRAKAIAKYGRAPMPSTQGGFAVATDDPALHPYEPLATAIREVRDNPQAHYDKMLTSLRESFEGCMRIMKDQEQARASRVANGSAKRAAKPTPQELGM